MMITSQIELRHLRYFVALADHRHFTRAAEAVHVSQPTLSQQIRQLEDALGGPLVDRIGKRVGLTAAGEALLPHARSVLQQLNDAHLAVSETRGLKVGHLNVAVVQTVNATLLPRLLTRFTRLYPGIQVSSREVAGDDLETGLLTGTYDLAIGFCPTTKGGLLTEPLFDEELVVIAPSAHALAAAESIRVRELAAHPLALLPRGYCTRELIQAAFAQAKVTPRVAMEINSIDSLLSTIQQTGFATILPSLAVENKLSRGLETVALTAPTPRRTVGLVWRAGAYRKAAAVAFAETATAVTHEVVQNRTADSGKTSRGTRFRQTHQP